MNRLNSFGIFLVSIGTAYLMFVFGYVISPMYAHITTASEALDKWVEMTSKILLWGCSGCLVISIFALVGAFIKGYSRVICTTSIYLIAVVSIAVTVSVALILFSVI